MPVRKNKYRNIRSRIDGFTFDSKLEAKRYGELKLLQKAGEIRDLEVHPRFPLHVKGVPICTYVADFSYHDPRGTLQVEDAKGVITAVYRIKKKLMSVVWGIEVVEIREG